MNQPNPIDAETSDPSLPSETSTDFIRAKIDDDIRTGKYSNYSDRVVTRFPPEPNGYLHIGHAKSICLNFGIANQYSGHCHLRFDDTNPSTEDMEYVESIQNDVRWLGFDWGQHRYFASDYFEKLYAFAQELIRRGKAYVDTSSDDEIRRLRGTISEPGVASPDRDRSVEENLNLFERMRNGEFEDGTHVLRAKIDLSATNTKMRDPLLYRIRKGAHHYRTGDTWCIYPFYDFAHCLSDAIEGITHSICTLEFENNRELYDWVLDNAGVPRPRPEQTEFARLNLSYTVMSKRRLLRLVQEKHVSGWDDPRMPTLSGMRRRGIRPSAIRAFCAEIGVARTHNVIDLARFEHIVRDDLNLEVPRVLCVLRPLEVIIDNYPDGAGESFDAPYYPRDVPKQASRKLPFGKRIFIEREDFAEQPVKGWFRLSPGAEVRLRYAYLIRCTRVVKDDRGNVIRLHCTYDPDSRGGQATDGRKVKGTIHWVSAEDAVDVQVRLYDRLFVHENPDGAEGDFVDYLNPQSLTVIAHAKLEPAAAQEAGFERFQFERQGYFAYDPDSRPGALVFNRIVTLRDTWAKKQTSESAAGSEAGSPAQAVNTPARQQALAGSVELTAPKGVEPRALTAEQARDAQRLADHGVAPSDCDLLAQQPGLVEFFETAIEAGAAAASVAKWIVNELMRELKQRRVSELGFDGRDFGELVKLVDGATITATAGKEVLAAMVAGQGKALEIIEQRGLNRAVSQQQLVQIVDEVLTRNQDKVAQYRQGKEALMGFFVGAVMRATQGKVPAATVTRLLQDKLRQ